VQVVSLMADVDELRRGQEKLSEVIEELRGTIEELKMRQETFQKLMSDLAISASKTEDTVLTVKGSLDRLSESLEAIVQFLSYQTLLERLKSRGLTPTRLIPLPIMVEGVHEEIRFYGTVRDGEGKELKIYADVKSSLRQKDVTEFAWVAKNAEKLYGQGKKMLIGFKVYGDAYQEAEKEDIEIIEAPSTPGQGD